MNVKIQNIKNFIWENKNNDGDSWIHGGNEVIYNILDTFNHLEWNELNQALINFTDNEHSIFCRAILFYDENRKLEIDNIEIFFKEFVLLGDYEDCDCLLWETTYLEFVKKPNIELFNNVRAKIRFLEDFGYSTDQEMLDLAYKNIDKAIVKHFG